MCHSFIHHIWFANRVVNWHIEANCMCQIRRIFYTHSHMTHHEYVSRIVWTQLKTNSFVIIKVRAYRVFHYCPLSWSANHMFRRDFKGIPRQEYVLLAYFRICNTYSNYPGVSKSLWLMSMAAIILIVVKHITLSKLSCIFESSEN